MKKPIAMLFACMACCAPPASECKDFSIRQAGDMEVVLAGDPCGNMSIPDSPARAIRLSDGKLVLMASHFTNVPLRGHNLKDMRAACEAASQPALNPDPEAFDDRFWVQALYPLSGARILGISSHEYDGRRHKGMCQSQGQNDCWYSSIIFTEANESSLRFNPIDRKKRVLLRPDQLFNQYDTGPRGYFSISNIVHRDEWIYLYVYAEKTDGVRRGNCLLRAHANDPFNWSIYSNEGFRPANQNPKCKVVGKQVIGGPIRSIVYAKPLKKFIAILLTGQADNEGIYYSTSDDLIEWSKQRKIISLHSPYGRKGCGKFFYYPSAIDQNSKSKIFDTIETTFEIYLTRFNFDDCNRNHRKRDLIRFPVKIITQDNTP